jgi:uncharacterized RDD family membrane protein YckC
LKYPQTTHIEPLPPKTLSPSLSRRLASFCYDALIVFAVVFAAGSIFIIAVDYPLHQRLKPVLQAVVLLAIGAYFIGFWCHGGQTVGMKTWRIQLVGPDAAPPSMKLATRRFVLAALGWALGGLSLWWALFDREKQFLHDRLLGTRLKLGAKKVPAPARSPRAPKQRST